MSTTARSTKAFGARAVHKPDPTAVVAKTEADHHAKAESLRRTNEKIDAIEQCIATDIGVEVDIRQRIAESQQVINDMKQKKAELDKIMEKAQEVIEKGEEEMKKNKDQRRGNHSEELRLLVEEQAGKLDDLKPAEEALYVELGQKIQGYKMNADEWDSSEEEDVVHDSDASQVRPAIARRGRLAPILAGPFGAKKRPAQAPMKSASPMKSAKKVCKEGPSKPWARFSNLLPDDA